MISVVGGPDDNKQDSVLNSVKANIADQMLMDSRENRARVEETKDKPDVS